MPRLQFFILCDKAIMSQDDNDLSLISILDGLRIEAPPTRGTGEEISFPYSWTAVSQWIKEDSDEGKSFVEQLRIILPGGGPSGKAVTPFDFVGRSKALNITRGTDLPFTESGVYRFRLGYREVADEGAKDNEEEWKGIVDYPLTITVADEPSDLE